ncbi:MAG: von Willebrand factor type domain protein [Anaeromyxobacteraceae bacterium]|nr:von Willebrand factor type domain protein [Anaeromyxobacteraceae bacterium]
MKRSAVLIALAVAACGPSVKSVSVEPARSVLEVKGGTTALRAVARDEKGQPVDASKLKVAWSSSAPQTATVDEAGNVTAQRSGEATVTAAVGEVKGAAQVVVSIPASVSVSSVSRDLRPGETVVLTVVVVDDAAKPVTVPRTITWSSSDPEVARVVDGKLEAVGPGSTTITAAAGSLKGTSAVKVRIPDFARLALTPAKTQTLKKGDRLTFKVAALDKKGQKVAGVPVSWKSSDPRVATVSADGIVAAVKKGSAKITASASGKAATVGVTVTDAAKPKAKAKKKK